MYMSVLIVCGANIRVLAKIKHNIMLKVSLYCVFCVSLPQIERKTTSNMNIDELKQYVKEWRRKQSMKKMQVYDLAGDISDVTLIHETTILAVLHALFPAIKNKIDEGYNIEIGGLGEFKLKDRRPKLIPDGIHGGYMFTPAYKHLVFKPDLVWKLIQKAKTSDLPEDTQLPDGVHLGWRLETMFRNHNMHGYHRKDATLLEDDIKAYQGDEERDDEIDDDDLEL